VSDEEYRQSKMGGLPGECKIKAASTGGTAALLILIKYIQILLELVLQSRLTHPFSEHTVAACRNRIVCLSPRMVCTSGSIAAMANAKAMVAQSKASDSSA
jgi:hypothetical protein